MLIACFTFPQFGIAVECARRTHLFGSSVALINDTTILVASSEAEARGVRTGQTISAARSLCPDIALLPYDLNAYEEAARLLWDVLAIESSIVEPVSPELC